MMRLSPLLQPLASACCRAAATHGLPFARPLLTASCNPRTQQPQLVLSNSSSSSCRLAAPPRCISSSSGDQEGGSRPKGDGGNDNNNSVPRAESRQQQAVEQLTQLLQESLKAQQHTQELVNALVQRQEQQHAEAQQLPSRVWALVDMKLTEQHRSLMEGLAGLEGVLELQQRRHQEAEGQRQQQQADAVQQLLGQHQKQQEALQRQEVLMRYLLVVEELLAVQSLRSDVRHWAPDAGEAGKGGVLPEEVKVPGGTTAAAMPESPKQPGQQQELPRLLDYVRVKERIIGAMLPGTEGVALGSRGFGSEVKVWSLDDPSQCFWHARAQLEKIPDEASLKTTGRRMQYLPYDPERKGVPVTRFTAAPGMLVRRGYDVREGEEREAAAGEVGVIQPRSLSRQDICKVEWAGGPWREYNIGWATQFELVHLEVSPTIGASVVAGWKPYTVIKKQRGNTVEEYERPFGLEGPPGDVGPEGGVAVERGTHWTYGGAEPGVGTYRRLDSEEEQQQLQQERHELGLLPVEWPNGQLLHHRASPINGYDLCYSAWPGDPVTLFTARQGLRVDLGGGVRGTLDVPMRVYWGIARWGVEWRVATDAAVGYQYYLLRTHDSERLARDLVPGAGPPFSGTLEYV